MKGEENLVRLKVPEVDKAVDFSQAEEVEAAGRS